MNRNHYARLFRLIDRVTEITFGGDSTSSGTGGTGGVGGTDATSSGTSGAGSTNKDSTGDVTMVGGDPLEQGENYKDFDTCAECDVVHKNNMEFINVY